MSTNDAINHASQCYGIASWGDGYFSINEQGEVTVSPFRDATVNYPLAALVKQVQAFNLKTPLLLRFPDIITDRIRALCSAFNNAMQQLAYQGNYTAIYPIKVNQQIEVVDAVISCTEQSVGLEAGSKPELLAVLALPQSTNKLIICNGYKDADYLRYALIGQAMGHQVQIIVEKPSELLELLKVAAEMHLQPNIGFRVRLSSIGKGKWQNTGGDKAKFGLSAIQLLDCISLLQKENKLHWLSVLHFHMGSQIANIRDIQNGVDEAAQYYAELKKLGAPLPYVDVGGGLGVDYEGSCSRSACSMNYSLTEYANTIVKTFQQVCLREQCSEPHLLSESGRAMVAHHALLVSNFIDQEAPPGLQPPAAPTEDSDTILHKLWQDYNKLQSRPLLECFHEAQHALSEVQLRFKLGTLSLQERAAAEKIYYALLQQLNQKLDINIRSQRELQEELSEKLATKYFLNFSIFQSTPDVWAIRQIFPIMPLTQLQQPLSERAVLQDLTCDSDGRIDDYIDGQNIEASMALPKLDPSTPYLLGIFLLGAYQETLGDIHNLFGDTNSITARWNPSRQCFTLNNPNKGDSAAEVLGHVNFSKPFLLKSYESKLHNADISSDEHAKFLRMLTSGLNDSTYLLAATGQPKKQCN